MKRVTLVSWLFCFVIQLNAQTNFEGRIDFRMTSPDSSVNVVITAYYKKDKIRFDTQVFSAVPGMDVKNERIIIDFSDSSIFRIKEEERFVETEKMVSNKNDDLPQLVPDSSNQLIILDRPCTGYSAGQIEKKELKEGKEVTTKASILIWYADDLLFIVPSKFHLIQMVPLFTNGHIALGSDIHIESDGQTISLHTRATKMEKRRLHKKVFALPAGFPIKASD